MSTRRSLAFAFLDRYATLAITIVSSMLIARLLTPEELGVYAVTMALLTLLMALRDFGAGQYLVQEPELSPARMRAVWTVQLGVGLLLAALTAAASGPAAHFYGERRVADIMWVLALNFAINPFGAVTYAWLMREMRYGVIAVMRTVSTLAGAVVSVWLAAHGFGPVSLAWGNLAAIAVNAACATVYRPAGSGWLPGFAELPRVLSFGTRMTATSLIGSVAAAAPEFLLGKLHSLTAAGLYSRANGLVAMFNRLVNDAVGSVALALFAREAREGQASGETFARAVAYVTGLAWPFAAFVGAMADPIVRILYGPQWGDSVPAVRVLSVGLCFGAVVPLCSAALVGRGAVRSVLGATAGGAVLLLAACGVAAARGTTAVAIGAVVATMLASLVWIALAARRLDCPTRRLARPLLQGLAVMACAAVVPLFVVERYGWSPAHPLAPLVWSGAGAVLGFVVGIRMVRHPLAEEFDRWRRLRPDPAAARGEQR